MGKLKLEDLDPLLQSVYDVGCEMQFAMENAVKQKEGVEKTVLNVTCGDEKNYKKPIKEMIPREPGSNELIEATVGYEKDFRWRVHFGYTDKEGKIHDCFSSAVDGVKGEEQPVIDRTQRIAGELQKVYGLSYTPQIHRDGRSVA
ncbi:hypothetical protein HOE04_01060 [archaeon]|jgi:hypothetical protein|nr:hypothetical protein [archaeon]